MNCATSSLPAPLSPVMNTDASVAATLRASSIAWRNSGGVRGAADQDLQLRAGERLGEIVPRARTQHLEARFDARLAGDDDGDRIPVGGEGGLEQLYPRYLRHVEIDEDDVERAPLQGLEGLAPAARSGDVVSLGAEYAGATLAQRALVVDHEHADALADRLRDGDQVCEAGRPGRRAGTESHYSVVTSDKRTHRPLLQVRRLPSRR